MRYVTGDLFEGGYASIGQGVNCVGVQGAGIARGFRERFPSQYWTYQQLCQDNMLKVGQIHAWEEGGQYGYNIASQASPGPNATIINLRTAMLRVMRHARIHGVREVAIPKIGCGIGGLHWYQVKPVIEAIAVQYPDVEIIVVSLD